MGALYPSFGKFVSTSTRFVSMTTIYLVVMGTFTKWLLYTDLFEQINDLPLNFHSEIQINVNILAFPQTVITVAMGTVFIGQVVVLSNSHVHQRQEVATT